LFLAGGLLWSACLFWTLLHLQGYASPVLPLGRVVLLGINLLHMATLYLLVIYTRLLRQAVRSFLLAMTGFNLVLLAAGAGAIRGLLSFERFLVPEAAPVLVGGQVMGADVQRFMVGVVTGNLSAAALVLLAAVSLQRTNAPGVMWRWAAAAIAVTGIVLGFSRQVAVGLTGGLVVVGLDLLRRGRLKRLGLFLLSLPFVGGLFWLTAQLPPTQSFFQALAGRAWLLADEGSYSTGTAGEKLRMWGAMLEDVSRNPLLGAGQDSYMVYYPSTAGGGSHNFPIEILHATGLSGFLPYAYLHAALLWTAWGVLRRARPPNEDRWLLLGLAGAFVVVVLSSLTNLIFWTQAYWLLAGLLAAGSRLTARARLKRYAHRIRHPDREPG
jgi:O-antigen ligase